MKIAVEGFGELFICADSVGHIRPLSASPWMIQADRADFILKPLGPLVASLALTDLDYISHNAGYDRPRIIYGLSRASLSM